MGIRLDGVRGQIWSDTRVRTADGVPMRGDVRLPELPGVEPKRDPGMDTAIRLVADHPLLVGGAGAAGMVFGAGMTSGILRRVGGGMLGTALGLTAGIAMSAIAQRVSGRSSSSTEAYVRDVPGAGTTPRVGERGEQLRVMDWNLRQFTGPSSAVGFDEQAFDAVAATVEREQPDVLVLQEVSMGAVESGRTDQLDMLEDRLGASSAVFVPNGRRPDGGLKGNAVLTFGDAQVQDARGLYMPDPEGAGFLRRMKNIVGLLDNVGIHAPESWKAPYFPRTVGDVIVTTAGGTDVRVVDAHLSGTGRGSGGSPGSSEAQERQLVPLASTMDAWGGATILAGDFNVNRGSDAYEFERDTLAAAGLRDSFSDMGLGDDDRSVNSFSSSHPSRNIDRVYVSKEFQTSHSRVLSDELASRGSDHLPVVTDVVVG